MVSVIDSVSKIGLLYADYYLFYPIVDETGILYNDGGESV